MFVCTDVNDVFVQCVNHVFTKQNAGLQDKADRYYRAREVLGEDMIDNAVQVSREREHQLVRHKRIRQEL